MLIHITSLVRHIFKSLLVRQLIPGDDSPTAVASFLPPKHAPPGNQEAQPEGDKKEEEDPYPYIYVFAVDV